MEIHNLHYFEELSDAESMIISGGTQGIQPPLYDITGQTGLPVISTPQGSIPPEPPPPFGSPVDTWVVLPGP